MAVPKRDIEELDNPLIAVMPLELQVEVATLPLAVIVRQGLPDDARPEIIKLVVVAVPLIVVEPRETSPPD